MPVRCPLCRATGDPTDVRGADGRGYHLCSACRLIFADPRHHLPAGEEKARYANHRNSAGNRGYVGFLNRVLLPTLPYLDKSMRGLDYGCGPGPTLSRLVRRRGIACDDYDPLFERRPLRPPYDFIFSTECFEHFRSPDRDIRRICGLLRLGGVLSVMTERWTTIERFAEWHYTRDPTHVSFYHDRTFDYLGQRHGLEPLWRDEDRVAVFRKMRKRPSRPGGGEGAVKRGDPRAEMTRKARLCRQITTK